MAWIRHEIIWTEAADDDMRVVAQKASGDVALALVEAIERYANRGLGDALDPMISGPWRGLSRLKPVGIASDYRMIFKRFPLRRLIRVERVGPRDEVYLRPPSRSR